MCACGTPGDPVKRLVLCSTFPVLGAFSYYVKSRRRLGGCMPLAIANGFRTHSVFTRVSTGYNFGTELDDADHSFPFKPQNVFQPYMSIEGVHSRE